MNPMDPRDQHTARYEPGYQPGNYRDPGYGQDHGYSPGSGYSQDHGSGYGHRGHGYSEYQQSDLPDRQPRQQQGPEVNIGMFVGGVIAAAVVTALAAWLCALIIEIIATRVTESGALGVWNPMAQDAYWFAVVAFICTLLAGLLWYLLRLGTPSPELFFSWIVGILTAAAVIIPLALSSHLWVGISTGIEHLVIGLPILSLVRMVGAKSIVPR
ncbi:hypothetical protein IU486_16770 [Streptomyces gardneri]|nr:MULTISPECIES: hypothetical protein [Nocardia]MBF6166397.1 hypothetical protein [Streptomyces gardneri]MBF6205177.1 hypothetical protein [Streptomyces gardneri]